MASLPETALHHYLIPTMRPGNYETTKIFTFAARKVWANVFFIEYRSVLSVLVKFIPLRGIHKWEIGPTLAILPPGARNEDYEGYVKNSEFSDTMDFVKVHHLIMEQVKANWTIEEILDIYHSPLLELVYRAATIHRQYHNPNEVQISTLLSIKTGGCPEDCAYCPQAARYFTDIETNDLLSVNQVETAAQRAKELGSSRLCMGAAWRNVKDDADFDHVLDLVRTVNELDMEVCCTLGMVTEGQAQKLADAGLYAYNHNLDTSEDYYKEIISTRGYEDRLKTLDNVRKAKLTVCSGGIIGMGESVEDRCKMLKTLASLRPQPESVPINALVAVEGTPMEDQQPVPIWDMVRMVATTRIVIPQTTVRLSAGRTSMSREGQALCFMAGASSIFAGDKLLTTPNPDIFEDLEMFDLLGLQPTEPYAKHPKPEVKSKVEPNAAANGEKVRWSRPMHKIEANIQYAAKAKEKRKVGEE